MDDHDVITAFHNGIANGTLINKWTHKPPKMVNEMFIVTSSWADSEQVEKEQLSKLKHRWEEESKPRSRRIDRDRADDEDRRDDARGSEQCGHKRKSEANVVAALDQANGRISPEEFQKMVDMQCSYHKNHKHSACDCFALRRAFQGRGNRLPQNRKDDCPTRQDRDELPQEDFQDANRAVNMIYGGPEAFESKRQQKLTN
ncbi:unnamed protein product [Urochloa humidicola]